MTDEQPKLGAFPYVVGGLSYIPLLGILYGGVALIWGLVTKKSGGKRLAAIGAGGILLTVVLYGALFYFAVVQRGGIYDDLRAKLAANTLTSLVQAIEVYKLQNGKYPDSLGTLRQSLPKDSLVFLFDPTDARMNGSKSRYFYYDVVDAEHYYLRSVGPDGQPFTADDILPHVEVKPGSKIGLLTERISKASNPRLQRTALARRRWTARPLGRYGAARRANEIAIEQRQISEEASNEPRASTGDRTRMDRRLELARFGAHPVALHG